MKKKVLSPYFKAGFQRKHLFLGFGSILKCIEDEYTQKVFLRALALWKAPHTISEITKVLSQQYEKNTVNNVIKDILENNYVIDENIYDRELPYSRNGLYYSLSKADMVQVQNRLETKKIVILGCGGIGNMIAVSLATIGVKKLLLVDDDTIESSNLTRQFMFSKSDIGKYKCDVLKKAILDRSFNTDVDVCRERVSKNILNKLSEFDLIVLSADSPDCLDIVNTFCVENNIPYINVGYVQDIAVWGPFVIPGKTGCFYCKSLISDDGITPELASEIKEINKNYQTPSNAGVNMLASSLGLLDIIKYLGEFGSIQSLNKRIGLWTDNLRIEEQDSSYNKNCRFCSKSS